MEKFDTEVGVSFSSSKRTSRSCICLVILSVAVVLLLAISAIFVTFYVMDERTSAAKTSAENASFSTVYAPSTDRSTASTASTARPSVTSYLPTTQKAREQKYCGSKACLLTSLGKLIFLRYKPVHDIYNDMLALFWRYLRYLSYHRKR